MTGGSRPVRPKAVRSSAVKAVPLFNIGELSTASPRALVSWWPSTFCWCFVTDASSGITLRSMLLPSLLLLIHPARRGAPGMACRAADHELLADSACDQAKRERPAQCQQSEQ